MIISMIAAMGRNRVIGRDNDLPWHLPDDFKYFQQTTKGHYVIMGRKNWQSLPHKFKPLPERTNLIITRQQNFEAEGGQVFNTLEDAIALPQNANEEEAFIIGGGEIYRMGLAYANRIYLTEINGDFEGSVTFPEFSKVEWIETSRVHHSVDDRHNFSFDFVIYEKKEDGHPIT